MNMFLIFLEMKRMSKFVCGGNILSEKRRAVGVIEQGTQIGHIESRIGLRFVFIDRKCVSVVSITKIPVGEIIQYYSRRFVKSHSVSN